MKFWDEIIAFNNEHFPDWRKRDLIYYSNAIAGEAGEFCGLTKALVGGGTKKKDITLDKMIFEQLDILIYLILALERVGVSQVTIDFWFNKKLEIIKERMIVPPKQSEKYFSITCPGCKKTTNWIHFGSDWICSKCNEWHFWWGAGWVKKGEKPNFNKVLFIADSDKEITGHSHSLPRTKKYYRCKICGWESKSWYEEKDDHSEQRLGYHSDKVGMTNHSKEYSHHEWEILVGVKQ